MKRSARDESAMERPTKQNRTKEDIPSGDCFSDGCVIKASALTARDDVPEDKHIAGQVFMLWPVINNILKLQLKSELDSLDVVFEGPGVQKLDFLTKDMVRISLKGARVETKKAATSMTLPFRLVFSKGAIVQLLASQKREKEKLVDLFQDAEERKRNKDDDWFFPSSLAHTSPVVDSPTIARMSYEAREHPQHDPFPAHLWQDFPGASMSTNVSPTVPLFQQEPRHEFVDKCISRNTEDEKYFLHKPNTGRTASCEAMSTTSLHSRNLSVSDACSANTPQSAAHVQPKEKRVKKRDTRHTRDSSNPTPVNAKDLSVSDSQIPSGKKARKRQASKLRAEVERVNNRSMTPLPPPRDPALDLDAGFYSEHGGLYTPLAGVAPGKAYSLVGVVTDVGPIKVTRTGERSKSFLLVDPSQCKEGLTVVVFVSPSDEELLPSAKPGQILLLKQVKIKEHLGRLQGTCYKDSFRWCGYDPTQGKHFYTISESSRRSSISEWNHDAFFKVAPAELEYFVKISDWWRSLQESRCDPLEVHSDSGGNVTTQIVPRTLGRRHRLVTISELKVGEFVDCVIQLLGINSHEEHHNAVVLVTDYTENKNLPHHSEVQSCPMGRRTLSVTLWDGAYNMVDDLEIHGYYLLENLRVKDTPMGYIEGTIGYQDRGIRKIGLSSTHQNFAELLFRKRKYEENPHLSELHWEKDLIQVPEPIFQGHSLEDESIAITRGAVECLHLNQKLSSIEEVLQCPVSPNKFRIRARIVEYYPRHIGNFVTVECNKCAKVLGDEYHLCPDCGDLTEGSTTMRYQFALRVADVAGTELNISVSGKEADEFLVGLCAKDARDDVEGLKMRFLPLLGHLEKWHETFDEETKNESGPWLDLCVYDWVSDATRSYKLFGCLLRAATS
ncbi:hypothetical protein K439DRAFT_1628241 [Ramaria rubella]|nr:hypothetical protein K439DRAFT_1628241 [Ramaria rubella]